MQNTVVNMCEKFHNDRLRNDRALWNGKSDNNNKNNVRSVITVQYAVLGCKLKQNANEGCNSCRT